MREKGEIIRKIELLEEEMKNFEDNPQDNIRREFKNTEIRMLEWVLK